MPAFPRIPCSSGHYRFVLVNLSDVMDDHVEKPLRVYLELPVERDAVQAHGRADIAKNTLTIVNRPVRTRIQGGVGAGGQGPPVLN